MSSSENEAGDIASNSKKKAPWFDYVDPFKKFLVKESGGPLAEAISPYFWYPVTSAAVERSFSLAGLVDAKNRQKMGKNLRQAAVTMFCNGDTEQQFHSEYKLFFLSFQNSFQI